MNAAIKAIAMSAMASLPSIAVAANVWYVAASNYGKPDLTGKDKISAYGTIQDAISKASSGDTIYVAPGVYDKGSGTHVETWGPARIGWNNKRLYIYSTGNAGNTFIVGKKSSETAEGNGSDAVRCFAQYNKSSDSHGSILKGFTFCGGGAPTTSSQNAGVAGAILADTPNIYFVDCVISNCTTYSSGLVRCGTYVRCLFSRNTPVKGATCFMGITSSTPIRFYACVFHHNMNGLDYGSAPLDGILVHFAQLVNCTLVDNIVGSCCYGTGAVCYNTVFFATGALSADCAYTNCVSSDPFPVMSTIHPDVRPIAGRAACTAGDGSYLSKIELPDEIGYRDYGGNLPATSGTIAAGATQTVGTPAAGGIATWGGATSIDGTGRCKAGAYSYVFPDAYPTQYVFTAEIADGKRLRFVQFTNPTVEGYDYRFPTINDELLVMPPPDTGVVITNHNTSVADVCYVKPDADAAVADGSAQYPYRTLQAAHDAAADKVIVAKAGVYNEGSTVSAHGLCRLLTSKVVRITSEEGPESTFLVGEADTSTEADGHGRGPGAIRCVVQTGNMAQLQGFTLTGGHTATSSGYGGCGGAAFSATPYLNLSDCIISNNCAKESGAVYGGRLTRCLVTGNHSDDFVLSAGNFRACVVRGNTMLRPQNGVFGSYSRVIHCTVIGDKTTCPYGNSSTIKRYASVFLGGDTAGGTGISYGNVCWDMAAVDDVSATVGDPLLAYPADHDWHPFASSPVFTCVPLPDSANYGSDYWFYATTDYDGNPLFAGGRRPVAGAYSSATSRRMVSVKAENGGVSPATERVEIAEDGTCTLTVGTGTRPLVGVVVNGVTNLVASADWSLDIQGADAVGGISVAALYGNDWYAAQDGDDMASGFYPDAAKTLQGALTNEFLMQGDRVLALPGTYASGKMIQSGDYDLYSRAVVPANVTLESTGGRDVTMIVGAQAETIDADPHGKGYDMRGLGVDALRCVYLQSGAKVKGFTITNGWTRAAKKGTSISHGDADTCGGGIGSYALGGTAEDCLVVGCGAYRGGGAFATVCRNCEFADGYAVYGGGATSDSSHYGCLSHGNTALLTYGYGLFYIRGAMGCTCVDSIAQVHPYAATGITNTLVTGWFYPTDPLTALDFSCCAFRSDRLVGVTADWFDGSIGCIVTNLDALALDAGYRPVIGQNVCIDAGLDGPLTDLSDTDLAGTRRICNGAMDIGALEANWLGVYSRDIARSSRFAVTNAGPYVVESDARTVRLAPGESLQAAWNGLTGRNVKTTLKVRVTGTGTLTVTQDDGTVIGSVTVADGDRTLHFTVPASGMGLDVSYAKVDGDAGYAEILGSDWATRSMLIFR